MSVKLPRKQLRGNESTSVDRVCITCNRYKPSNDDYRTWTVSVAIDDGDAVEKELKDPLKKDNQNYQQAPESYFNRLVSQLGLKNIPWQRYGLCKISIHEELDQQNESTTDPKILCLFWEILENVGFWPSSYRPQRLMVWRTLTFKEGGSENARLDSMREYHILLVIARSFRRVSEAYIDCRPSIVLGPLVNIATWCNRHGHQPRVRVDVVRPGTIEVLKRKLQSHEKSTNRSYDLIHLDMHGKMDPPGSPVAGMPYLRFAKRSDQKFGQAPKSGGSYGVLPEDDSLRDIDVTEVANLLNENGITKIALNACLSSYAQGNLLANMCYIFLRHGASHVSGMSSEVLQNTAQRYYEGFYYALLLQEQTFPSAAAFGREILRADNRQVSNALIPTIYRRLHNSPKHGHDEEDILRRCTKKIFRLIPTLAMICRLGASFVSMYPLMTHFPIILGLIGVFLWCWLVHLPLSPARVFVVILFVTLFVPLMPKLLPLYIFENHFPACSALLNAAMYLYPLLAVFCYSISYWMAPLKCPFWIEQPLEISNFYEQNNQFTGYNVEIEHLYWEDILELEANEGAIYLWNSEAKASLSSVVSNLARIWVDTDFVDSVDIVSAMGFWWQFLPRPLWEYLWVTRYTSGVADRGTEKQGRLAIITDINELFEYYQHFDRAYGTTTRETLPSSLEDVLLRMAEFVSCATDADQGPGKTSFIITGSQSDDRWRTMTWGENNVKNTVGRAKPYNSLSSSWLNAENGQAKQTKRPDRRPGK